MMRYVSPYRHAELVCLRWPAGSASIGTQSQPARLEKWTLKQVQGDEMESPT